MKYPQSILVLDDEPNFCRVLEAKLNKSSFEVSTAFNALDAFRQILSRPFDLILLDLRLPDAYGMDLLPRLRAVAPAVPIILMTAYEVEGLREEGLKAGAVDVLYKPFDLNSLVGTVKSLIEAGSRRGNNPETEVPLTIGKAVTIQFLSGPLAERFPATIRDAQAETFGVTTTAPIEVDSGAPVLVSVAGTDALYEFRSSVARAPSDEALSLVRPTEIQRNQRRRHTRCSFRQTVELRLIEAAHFEQADSPFDLSSPAQSRAQARSGSFNGIAIELSAGGMCVALAQPLPAGSRVEVSFEAPGVSDQPFELRAAVVRCETINGHAIPPLYRIGLQFTSMSKESLFLLRGILDEPVSI